jgi:hypothetical protein
MGLTRKTMSLFSMGAVDFRSDKERTAAYTRGIRRQSRKQTKILKQQSRTQALPDTVPDTERLAKPGGWRAYDGSMKAMSSFNERCDARSQILRQERRDQKQAKILKQQTEVRKQAKILKRRAPDAAAEEARAKWEAVWVAKDK